MSEDFNTQIPPTLEGIEAEAEKKPIPEKSKTSLETLSKMCADDWNDTTKEGPSIDLRNIESIFNAYFSKPTNIKDYYISEKEVPTNHHRNALKVFHNYYEQTGGEAKNIDTTITDNIINRDIIASDEEKRTLMNFFATTRDASSSNKDAENIAANYRLFEKEWVVKYLYDNGQDVSKLWEGDPKNIGDPAAQKLARDNFRKSSYQDIINFYEKKKDNLLSAAVQRFDFGTKHSIKPTRVEDIPGVNDRIDYLIGFNKEKEEDSYGWMEEGSFNSIVAPAKAGKTQLMMQMAYCVQNGIEFMGMPVKKGNVLYVDFELRPNQIYKRMKLLDKHYAVELKGTNPVYPYYISASKMFANGEVNLDELVEICKKTKLDKETYPNLKMIIFDCFYTFAEGDSNTEEDTRNTLLKIKSLVDDQTTVCYVHHTNKQGAGKFEMLDMIYAAGGSGVHGKIVDTTYVIKPINVETGRFDIFTTGRSCTGSIKHCERTESTNHFFKEIKTETLKEREIREQLKRDELLEVTKEKESELYNFILAAGEKGHNLKNDKGKFKKKYPDLSKDQLSEMGFYCNYVNNVWYVYIRNFKLNELKDNIISFE